jgi:predicted acetyltransferase
MEGPRATKPEEVQSVIDLVNLVFRTGNQLKPTMGIEFPLLLCEANRDNMRIITEDGHPVSDINYYPASIAVERSTVRVASIGAVCTHPDYRGRNYATAILDDVEDKMRREGVEVMLVSGSRGLYLRRHCVKVGGFYKALLKPNKEQRKDLTLTEIDSSNIREAVHLYHQEAVRYHRTFQEFIQFHKGATTPWGNMYYKSYLIHIGGKAAAYMIVRFFTDTDRAEVREFAGDRGTVISGIYKMIQDNSLTECSLVSARNDVINILLEEKGIQLQHQDQQGTLKILNYPSLMNSLKSYMRQYLPDDRMDLLKFEETDGEFMMAAGEETLTIDSMELLGQLLFSQREQEPLTDALFRDELADKPRLRQILSTVFPIPFPWTGNMNFI